LALLFVDTLALWAYIASMSYRAVIVGVSACSGR